MVLLPTHQWLLKMEDTLDMALAEISSVYNTI